MATHLSRTFFSSATTVSSVPFLYQTRTLAPLSYPIQRSISRRFQHNFPTATPKHLDSEGRDTDETSTYTDPSRSAQDSSGKHLTHNEAASDVPVPRKSYLRRRGAASAPSEDTANERSAGSASKPLIRFTRNEKIAFRGLRSKLLDETHPANGEPETASQSRNLDSLMDLFDSVLTHVQSTKTTVHPETSSNPPSLASSQTSTITSDMHSSVVEDLRTIRLSDLTEEGLARPHKDQDLSMTEAMEIVAKREYSKIEEALFSAIQDGKGDKGLWDVCQSRIFAMLKHLDEQAPATRPGTMVGSSSVSYGSRSPSHTNGPLAIPSLLPVGPLVAKLYPECLLLAFRMLGTHFPQSDLIGQFHSNVKGQGRLSAFLGTSKPLYEEMIHFSWSKYRDLPAVVAFLREMDLAGLDTSKRVHLLLHDIAYEHQRDTEKGKNAFWEFPPNRKAIQELVGPGGWIETFISRAAIPEEHANKLPYI